jgi:adenylate cyclase
MLQGWVLVAQGEVDAGLLQMRQTLEASQATGAEIWRPYYLALLAETYGKAGQSAEGLDVLTEAIALASNSGGHWWEAELYRLQGALLLMQDSLGQRVGEIEACFHHALNVARRQQAKSLELRAATSFARL